MTIVLGAGISGISASYHLTQKGIENIVFEKDDDWGGLCGNFEIEGFRFDKVTGNDVEVTDNNTIVKVYYKTINDLKYNVEYYYDGEIDSDNGYTVKDVTYGATTTYTDKVKEGYRFKNVVNNDVKVTNNNITVKVYYEYIKDLSYKVEYYYDGVIDNNNTFLFNNPFDIFRRLFREFVVE